MKLLYATSITLPSYRANRIQITSMARAWTDLLGGDFVLGVGSVADDSLQNINHVVMGERVRSYKLSWRYLRYAKANGFTHIYCREEKLLFFMVNYNKLFFKMPLTFCYELHHLLYMDVWWHKFMLHRINRVISITKAMKSTFVASGYAERNILVAPDAVDLSIFNTSLKKDEARKRLGLPQERKIVVYTGNLDEPWRGADTLYEAAKQLGEEYLLLVVGSKPHHVEYFRSVYPDLPHFKLVGYKPHREIPTYLRSADVVVIPNSGKSEISRISISPMKLFEYMASGVPIVASDLPSIREILNEENSFMVQPDVAADLTRGIRAVTENSQLGTMLATQALKDVSIYTWEARAQKIISFIQ